MYKMVEITKETWKKCRIEVIIFNGKKWLNEKHIEDQLKHSNLPTVTNQYCSEFKKQRQEIQNGDKYQRCRRFLEEDFAMKIIIIMDCKTTSALKF